MKPVCFLLSAPPVHLALLPAQFYSRQQDLPFSTPGSFSITRCPCAGHQMTTQPPEERSSSHLLIWAAARSPPARSARGRTTSACLREGGVRGPSARLSADHIGLSRHPALIIQYRESEGEKKRVGGKRASMREREKCGNIFMDFRCFIVCARLPHRYM